MSLPREPKKHGFVEDTLTRAELEAPFRLARAGGEPITGPTRVYCEIEELDGVTIYADRDPWTGDVLQVGIAK